MNKKKGFTLAELLIVVAIIAVLVGIAIPVFSSQLTKAKEAADVANIRSAYAEAATAYMSEETAYPTSYSGPTLNYSSKLSWSVTDGVLTVSYDADKIEDLSLTADK